MSRSEEEIRQAVYATLRGLASTRLHSAGARQLQMDPTDLANETFVKLAEAGVMLNEALTKLEARSERQARIVELRFFAGLSVDETAAALGVSPRTVDGDWRMAKAWLRVELGA